MKAHQGCNKDLVPAEAGAETCLLDIQMNIYTYTIYQDKEIPVSGEGNNNNLFFIF